MASDPALLRAAALDPNFSDSSEYGPPRAAAQRQQPSILDLLRSRMANEIENERAQRLSDLGNALLTSRSPSLFGALGEGFRAQDEGARSRMDRLRQVAEAERQARAQQAEEQYRNEQLAIERQRRDFERDPRNPRNILYSEQAGFYRAGGSGAGRGQITPARLADLTLRAEAQALKDIPELTGLDAMRDTPAAKADREQRRRERARELLARAISTPDGQAAPGTVDTTPAPNQQPGRPVIRETFVPPEARR